MHAKISETNMTVDHASDDAIFETLLLNGNF
jgi:hypothetical protein